MKIEIEGTKTNKKDLWVDGYYVGKIDEDHNEVKLDGMFDWFDDEQLNYALNEYYDELKFVGEDIRKFAEKNADVCEELEPLIDVDEYVLEEEVVKVLEVCPEPFKSKLQTLFNNIKDDLKKGEVLKPTINYTITPLKYYANREYFKMEGRFLEFKASDENHIEVAEKELDSLDLHTISYFENKCLKEGLNEITLWVICNENDEEIWYYED